MKAARCNNFRKGAAKPIAFIRLDNRPPKWKIEKMKARVLPVCAFFIAVCAAANLNAQTPAADTDPYGPYPTQYKEIVQKWLNTQLIDADSARIEWNEDPKPANLGSAEKPLYGYLVHFRVNARNRFGAYTGMQSHGALIRNGEVVKGLGFGY
jgi:hypothetical protein